MLPSRLRKRARPTGVSAFRGQICVYFRYGPMTCSPFLKNGFVDRFRKFGFSPLRYPSYKVLTFTLMGLSPTEHTSFSWTHFRTAGFPQYGWKAGVSDGAFPIRSPLKPAPGIRPLTLGLHPSFAHHVVRLGNPVLSRADDYVMRHLGVGLYSAPGALAPLRVILSRCINAYRPHPTHSQAHHDFAVYATYTQCLRCAGAPRRPASGSELSLLIPC
jgi:hypothetical protein